MILRFARLTLALVLFVDLGCSNFIRTGWQPDIAVRPSTAIVVWAAPDPDKKDRARVFGIRFDTGEDAVEPRWIDPVPLQLSPVKFVNSPKVTPCGENRILVTWISGDGFSDERLVGRFLTSTFGELIAGSDGPGSGIFEIGEPQIHKLPDRSAFDYDVDFDPVHERVIVAWHQPLKVIEYRGIDVATGDFVFNADEPASWTTGGPLPPGRPRLLPRSQRLLCCPG